MRSFIDARRSQFRRQVSCDRTAFSGDLQVSSKVATRRSRRRSSPEVCVGTELVRKK